VVDLIDLNFEDPLEELLEELFEMSV